MSSPTISSASFAAVLLAAAPLLAQVPAQDPAAGPTDDRPVTAPATATVAERIDGYVDSRFEAPPGATGELLEALRARGVDSPAALEAALRSPRARYPDARELIGATTTHPVTCYHVDYESVYRLFVPKDFDPERAHALVVVGHGGNSSMSARRALSTADQYLRLYAPGVCERQDAVVVAPASERGWGPIGYSLIFSTIADVSQKIAIDPDRIYLTGQSMGGHLTYRMGMLFPDAFGAVSPHSGGYDFVEKGSIGNLVNVPGRAIFGSSEPYGINGDNRTNAAWAATHGLDWDFVEKNGGHTIYRDELPAMAAFFDEHPRDLYRELVFFRRGGGMKFVKTWEIKGWPEHRVASETRPMRWNRAHWVEVRARDDRKEPQEVLARNAGDNRVEVTCNRVRDLRLWFHPKMIDFERPVVVQVNGETAFEGRLEPDMALMLDEVRRAGDRGRIFWAALDLEVTTDRPVEVPAKR